MSVTNTDRAQILTVLEMHLDSWAIRNLAQPNVQILSFPGLEKEDIVAIVELGKLVKFVELGFGVKLHILPAMRQHGRDVVEQMSVPVYPMNSQNLIREPSRSPGLYATDSTNL
jgi:hypothetical protein